MNLRSPNAKRIQKQYETVLQVLNSLEASIRTQVNRVDNIRLDRIHRFQFARNYRELEQIEEKPSRYYRNYWEVEATKKLFNRFVLEAERLNSLVAIDDHSFSSLCSTIESWISSYNILDAKKIEKKFASFRRNLTERIETEETTIDSSMAHHVKNLSEEVRSLRKELQRLKRQPIEDSEEEEEVEEEYERPTP